MYVRIQIEGDAGERFRTYYTALCSLAVSQL